MAIHYVDFAGVSQPVRDRRALRGRFDPAPPAYEAPVVRLPCDRCEAPFCLITTFTIIN
jgi:hypothetical protein